MCVCVCVCVCVCRYLLRSQREWADRRGFERIYPRPSQRDAPGGDPLERLLGYIGQLYPEYSRARNTAAASPVAGIALGETSWMVRTRHSTTSEQTVDLLRTQIVLDGTLAWTVILFELLLVLN